MNVQQRPILKLGIIILTGVFLFGLMNIIGMIIVSSRPQLVQNLTSSDGKPVNNINVSATGKVSVKPDLAIFTAGYRVSNANLSTVQKEMQDKSNKLVSALKGLGIDEKDIQTSTFSIRPNYRYDSTSGRTTSDGHEGTLAITVKVRKIDETGKIIDQTLAAGANTIDNIAFTLDDPETARADARKLAVEAAKKKAQQIAAAAGVGVGPLVSINETSYDYLPYYANAATDGGVKAPTAAPSVITTGSLEVSLSVSATYVITQ